MNNHHNALILVDLQNDFFPQGALGIPSATEILPIIQQLLHIPFDHIIATKDWHPAHHCSFAKTHGKQPGDVVLLGKTEQILWPVHCVQGSTGADFYPGWDTSRVEQIIHKGTNPNIDSYSTFFDNCHEKETGLERYLKSNDVTNVYLAGLATDYCVKYSALDAVSLGFNTFVIIDACRGVNLSPDDVSHAITEMKQAGVTIIEFKELPNFAYV